MIYNVVYNNGMTIVSAIDILDITGYIYTAYGSDVLATEKISDVSDSIGGIVGYIDIMTNFGVRTLLGHTVAQTLNLLSVYSEYTEAISDSVSELSDGWEDTADMICDLIDIGEALSALKYSLQNEEEDADYELLMLTKIHKLSKKFFRHYSDYVFNK